MIKGIRSFELIHDDTFSQKGTTIAGLMGCLTVSLHANKPL